MRISIKTIPNDISQYIGYEIACIIMRTYMSSICLLDETKN